MLLLILATRRPINGHGPIQLKQYFYFILSVYRRSDGQDASFNLHTRTTAEERLPQRRPIPRRRSPQTATAAVPPHGALHVGAPGFPATSGRYYIQGRAR
jgi:hypothetical protein